MNATRGITVRARIRSRRAVFDGRVQTPTLAMLVERETGDRQFVPRDYWEIRGDFHDRAGERFSAMWRRVDPARRPTRPSGDPARSAAGPNDAGEARMVRWVSRCGAPHVRRMTRRVSGLARWGRWREALMHRRSKATPCASALVALARAIVARDTEQGAATAPLGPRVERVRARTVREPPPLLFDLTSLQRTANRRFGWSASRTLEGRAAASTSATSW